MKNHIEPARTIYLLHFESPGCPVRHYLGITASRRLEARMLEHATGRGSKTVARFLQTASSFTLARRWQNSSFEDERRMKRGGHLSRLCPKCASKGETTMVFQAYQSRLSDKQRHQLQSPDWLPYSTPRTLQT